MWSWTFCRLCPAKSCSLLTLPDITTNTQLENSPEPDRIHRSNPSQWNGCTHGTPTGWENRAADSSQVVPKCWAGLTLLHAGSVLPRYKETRGANRPMFSYCPSNSSEETESLHKGSNRKMQKNVIIKPSEVVPRILLQGAQSTPNSGTTLPQQGSHHTWPTDKWEASDPAKTDAAAGSARSQQANIILSEHFCNLDFSEVSANPRSRLQNAAHARVWE